MEDYGFEYSEEEPEEQDVDIENQYYNSKGKFLGFMRFFFSLLLNFHETVWLVSYVSAQGVNIFGL